MFHVKQSDVIVVGGGHAGAEAASAAARAGANVVLVTQSSSTIGVMSCNPAIGGVGKGHIVREIDALDGIMAGAADQSAIQYRLLNSSKGHAVRGPRIQADRGVYRKAVQARLVAHPNLRIVEAEVADLCQHGGRVAGIETTSGDRIMADAVVLTTGTFLNGRLFVGPDVSEGGRRGDPASQRLAHRLREALAIGGRLKTGTPPRLDGRSIAWDQVARQDSDPAPTFMSFLTRQTGLPQIACGVTHTNARTHAVVRDNIHLSAMYGGRIEGKGPRYCPSIEDKVLRFADRDSHQVFLEPEGLEDSTVYPNGLSTSLPPEVQLAYLQTLDGLSAVRVLQWGYAVEYDFFDPRQLTPALQVRALPGLYLAGQINGTTGYEEAAGQGLVAGSAAAGAAVPLNRANSYIGVMIDDLISRGVTEPYRMFTSRAEFRLALRADNADQRLTSLGRSAGIVGDGRWAEFTRKAEALSEVRAVLDSTVLTSAALTAVDQILPRDGRARTAWEFLGGREVDDAALLALAPDLAPTSPAIRGQAAIDALYAPYIQRQQNEVRSLEADLARAIPGDFDYGPLPGLSHELKEKLSRHRPASLAQARKVEGMTPAAIVILTAALKRQSAQAA